MSTYSNLSNEDHVGGTVQLFPGEVCSVLVDRLDCTEDHSAFIDI